MLIRLFLLNIVRVETLLALTLASIYLLVYLSDKYYFLLFLAVFTAGFLDIDYHRILKMFLWTVGTFYCITLVNGVIGTITNYVYTQPGAGVRSAWGFSYPTDFAAITLYIVMFLWVACQRLPDWCALLLGTGSLLVSWFVTHSRTSMFCSALFLAAILYLILDRYLISRNSHLRFIDRCVKTILMLAMPLCSALMFLLMFIYSRGFELGYRIDYLMSGRISFAVKACLQYGIKALGTPFKQAGNGFSTLPPAEYTFVDSSYPLILIRYGWVLFLTITLFWILMVRKAYRNGDKRLAMVMAIIAVHSLSEHHFIECHYNILIAMPMADYSFRSFQTGECLKKEKQINRGVNWANRNTIERLAYWCGAIMIGAVFVLAFASPRALERFKTFIQIFQMHNVAGNGWLPVGISAFAFLLIVLFVLSFHGLIRMTDRNHSFRLYMRDFLVLLLVVCAGMALWGWETSTVKRAEDEFSSWIEKDRDAIEAVLAGTQNTVCSTIIPSLYHQAFDRLGGKAYLFDDDLARLHDMTVLTDTDSEHNVFLKNGFLYTRISDDHAIYTNDKSAIDALSSYGYHMTGYYNNVKVVDLAEAAERNKLPYHSDHGLLIKGKQYVLKNGPYYDLYAGNYTVTYEMTISKPFPRKNVHVCTVSAASYKGRNEIFSVDIMSRDFDEDGKLEISVPFWIPDSQNVSFYAKTMKTRSVYINSIWFENTPTYDIHTFYDKKMKKIREEYYETSGEKSLVHTGYFCYEFGYDRQNNVNKITYLDNENQPILTNDGYAQIKRKYNLQRKIAEESYFGENGEPVSPRQYHSVKYSYDEDGNIAEFDYYGKDGNPEQLPGGYSCVKQEYDSNHHVINRVYCDADGNKINRSDGYAQVCWLYDEENRLLNVSFYKADGTPAEDGDLNLAKTDYNDWSPWITPLSGKTNYCVNIGELLLGNKAVGDYYTCQLEVEFRDVTALEDGDFCFLTQGAVDGTWDKNNIWNRNLLCLTEAPENGIYDVVYIQEITEDMRDASSFTLGFRCDDWGSGSFRVRNIKIERGFEASSWSPGI